MVQCTLQSEKVSKGGWGFEWRLTHMTFTQMTELCVSFETKHHHFLIGTK